MNKSESIAKLAKALSQAQANYESLTKDTKAHNYKYAKLDQYHENIQAAFSKVGLSYIQTIETGDKAVRATTMIMHESGEWIEGDGPWVPWTIKQNAAQDVGSATTYAKRYSLSSVAAIESCDDDAQSQKVPEGEKPDEPKPQKKTKANAKPQQDKPALKPVTPEVLKWFGGQLATRQREMPALLSIAEEKFGPNAITEQQIMDSMWEQIDPREVPELAEEFS